MANYASPEAIVVDERQDARNRPQINKDKSDYNTPYKMWLNVCLPEAFLHRLWGTDGWMNSRLSGKDNSAAHRKTSVGEGIQFYGYMLAIANNPGWPVRSMWSEKLAAGEKFTMPPPAYGRFGMSENRFDKLMQLHAFMHSISEDELDANDPWRYCAAVIDGHNLHWEKVYSPSWLLAPDESMSPWTVNEGIRHQDIPFLSHVPRKPKPLGAEIKTTADGESGAIIRCELALKYKRRRGAPTVMEPYRDEYGATSAQCLRLVEPWLKSRRCFGADAHFIGMDSIEALLEHELFPFGNIKQIRSRFPVDQLEQHCGPESGDWSVMTTRVLDGKLVYGVGHRRGGVVHTYVSTHGSTRRGRDQCHRDDADDAGHAAPPRKCPKILNDWTQAQPHIDKSNRWRQQILGIEERFRTTQFPFRLATTVIVGMAIASAHVLHR